MRIEDLEAYSEAWNAHDIDRIMAYMTDDCVFETGGGAERYGTRFEGFDEVRLRFIEVWTDIPDVRFENGLHFVQGCHDLMTQLLDFGGRRHQIRNLIDRAASADRRPHAVRRILQKPKT